MGTSHFVLHKQPEKVVSVSACSSQCLGSKERRDAGRALRLDRMLDITGRTELKVVNVPELSNDRYRQSRPPLHGNNGSG